MLKVENNEQKSIDNLKCPLCAYSQNIRRSSNIIRHMIKLHKETLHLLKSNLVKEEIEDKIFAKFIISILYPKLKYRKKNFNNILINNANSSNILQLFKEKSDSLQENNTFYKKISDYLTTIETREQKFINKNSNIDEKNSQNNKKIKLEEEEKNIEIDNKDEDERIMFQDLYQKLAFHKKAVEEYEKIIERKKYIFQQIKAQEEERKKNINKIKQLIEESKTSFNQINNL